MSGTINTNNDNDQVINFLIKNEEYFINVLDKFNKDYSTIPHTLNYNIFDTSNISKSILFSSIDGQYYPLIDNQYIGNVVEIINRNILDVFSIYMKTSISEELLQEIKYPIRLSVKYNVMVLNRSDFTYNEFDMKNYSSLKCDHHNFKELKILQYLYHKEEVYTDDSYYPYISEMHSFKKSLKDRINFAIFKLIDNVTTPVAKATVNGESPNAFQLGGIFTKKDHRKKGLAYYCLNDLIGYIFKNTSKSKIILYVKKDNAPAIQLYKKLGFKTIFETVLAYL